MKKLLIIAAVIVSAVQANAQTTATASQTVNLNLSNVIDLKFVSNNSSTGPVVNMNFNSISDYTNGIISADQQMVVQSNKNFNISVQSTSQNFTYTGSVSPAPVVQIQSVLQFMVTANGTGGSLSYSSYSNMPSGTATIINWGSPGANKTFSVKYKANPGFTLPGGTYTANILYTATQP